jgi:hypothetical protein
MAIAIASPAIATPMITSQPAPLTLADTSGRPTLAILPSLQLAYGPHNDYLYDHLRQALVDLGRFEVLDRGQVEALLGDRFQPGKTYGAPAELAKRLGVRDLVVAEMMSDPTPQVVEDKKDKHHYESYARATVRYLDVTKGSGFEVLDFSDEGKDGSSRDAAQTAAMDGLVSAIVAAVQERTPLSARILQRSGRTVLLDQGSNQGLRSDQFFTDISPRGHDDARIEIDRVEPSRAWGTIVTGYYDVRAGDPVLEAPRGSWPIAFGYANRTVFGPGFSLNQTLNALDLQFNPTGHGMGGGLEIGVLSTTGLWGGSVLGRLQPQWEVVPERFWFYGTVGGGLDVAYTSVTPAAAVPGAQAGDTASSVGFHALASIGANLSLGGRLNLFLEVGGSTPWRFTGWHVGSDDSSVALADSAMPAPTIGGPFTRVGAGWRF